MADPETGATSKQGVYAGGDAVTGPSTVIEAMAAGTPTITSNVSSLPEVVGDAAIKISPDDWTGMARAIESIISDREIYSGLKEMSVERAKRFSWKRASEETLSVYKQVLRV